MNIKADNAIILAAGYSSRFVPLCFDTSKALLPVKGNTLIERQILQLKEIGINEIYVITGAYKEQFEFLKEKHNVHLIFNKDYSTKNNFASIYTARDVLKNYIKRFIFSKKHFSSRSATFILFICFFKWKNNSTLSCVR